jgi:hypothetical protein
LGSIDPRSIGHEPGDGLTMPGNHDLLAALHAIQQTAKGIFGFEGADFGAG